MNRIFLETEHRGKNSINLKHGARVSDPIPAPALLLNEAKSINIYKMISQRQPITFVFKSLQTLDI